MGRMKEEYERQREEAQSGRRRYGSSDLTAVAIALGGEVVGEMIHCPSPGAPPEDRSLWVRVSSNNQVFIYHTEGSLGAAYKMARERLGYANNESDGAAFAIQIWNDTVVATGRLVETYLRSRALTLPIPEDLRFHGAVRHGPTGSYWPAMVAARRRTDGTLSAIHRTYLSYDGHKAPVDPQRMDLGPSKGTAIRLAPVADEMLIGEGIETVLSVMQATRKPGWAAGSAVALRNLLLPPEVRTIVLLADGDAAGESACRKAAQRWIGEGRRVRIARAPTGKDFNDLLAEDFACTT